MCVIDQTRGAINHRCAINHTRCAINHLKYAINQKIIYQQSPRSTRGCVLHLDAKLNVGDFYSV